jgi:hypothetical protein
MLIQWAFAIAIALIYSPFAWEGKQRVIHAHVYLALFMGAGLTLLPLVMVRQRAGQHGDAPRDRGEPDALVGGPDPPDRRAHRDALPRVRLARLAGLLPRLADPGHRHRGGGGDHFLRGVFYPESVYGITNPEWWRFLEHAFWVAFEDGILLIACHNGLRSLRDGAQRQAQLEALSESEQNKALALEMLITELKARPGQA